MQVQLVKDEDAGNVEIMSFLSVLRRDWVDTRDNRGKRHSILFVIAAFVVATLTGRQTLSSIHRFISNRLEWLRDITQIGDARVISRAHLPRLLAKLDWCALDNIIQGYFGIQIKNDGKEWIAVDGKALRGSQTEGDKQSIVFAVRHDTREIVGQARQIGEKSSEIVVVRELLKETGLEKQKVSLDAHHCNPTTLTQIHKADGIYLTQVKDNQPTLLQQCQALAKTQSAVADVNECDKGHGRVTTRYAKIYSLSQEKIDQRWAESGLTTLVVMRRETYHVAKKKNTDETSYYVSNQSVDPSNLESAKALTQAIRNHWSVESENWVRDVTFAEDKIKVKDGNQGQVMGRVRSLSISLLRKVAPPKNFRAIIEKFMDSVPDLEAMLRKVRFL